MSDRKEIPEVAHLRRMRRRIVKGWCQGAYARDKFQRGIDYKNPKACSWCLLGALYATSKGADHLSTVRRFLHANGEFSMPTFNDQAKSKDQVLAALDKAIRYARRVRVARPAA